MTDESLGGWVGASCSGVTAADVVAVVSARAAGWLRASLLAAGGGGQGSSRYHVTITWPG